MKTLLLNMSLILISASSFGQNIYDITFDDNSYLNQVRIDTLFNPNNIWRVGSPSKAVFTSAYSFPNVIVTDTVNPYPINDTVSFTVIHIADGGWASAYPKVDIGGWYYVNSDTLTDYGYIEFSPDLGNTWFRADSSEGFCTWGATEELPTFSGNSNGWKHFYYCLQVPYAVNFGDTILYRFKFISDGVQTNKDGLMFDDLHFEDWAEGIAEIQNDNMISISPDPTSDILRIHRTKIHNNQTVQILNYTGQVLYDYENFIGETIDTRQMTNGIYLLKYSATNTFSIKKFVIQH